MSTLNCFPGFGPTLVWILAIAIAMWSVFALALNPPMQASTIEAVPDSAMTAVSLNISGLYLGTAFAGGIGGLILELAEATFIPVLGAVALALPWLIACPTVAAKN